MSKLLETILEKVVDVLGDRAVILLDAKSRQKRAAVGLFHALRRFDDVLKQIPKFLEDGELSNKWERDELRKRLDDKQQKRLREFHQEMPDQLLALSTALADLNDAFHKADVALEIYGSRELRDWVEQAIGNEIGLISEYRHELLNTRLEPKERAQARLKLAKLTKTARQKVAKFIKVNYPAN